MEILKRTATQVSQKMCVERFLLVSYEDMIRSKIAPDITLSDSTVSDNVNERLRKLGYKSQ